jgi:hypothetical protein
VLTVANKRVDGFEIKNLRSLLGTAALVSVIAWLFTRVFWGV